MSVTMEDVRRVIDPEEPDYEFGSLLGPEALPHLGVLVRSDDPMLASKAAYLAGLIDGADATDVVTSAAQHDDAVVRVAAAAATRHLEGAGASDVLLPLLSDTDEGVRLAALKAVPDDASDAVRTKVEAIAADHGEGELRRISADVLRRTARPAMARQPAAETATTGEMPPAPDGEGIADAGLSTDEPPAAPPAGEMPS